MGKKYYLRIANRNPESARGYFPRRLLQVMGATTNHTKTDTDHGASQFGSGKKLAPVAALKLGMEAHLSSHDRDGPYFYTYGSEPDHSMGEEPQDVLTMTGHDGEIVRTDIGMRSAKNWTAPIGDDPVREYHVLREYVQDAYTHDPDFPMPEVTDMLSPAISGMTVVYLTYTKGIAHVLEHPERYFKYLSDAKPMFTSPGIGSIYPKSEKGMTRIFAKGQLASCSKALSEVSAYDYSLDKLSLMSEDRTFRSMYRIKREIGRLLVSINSVYMVRHLIDEMLAGRARLESSALQALGDAYAPPGAAAWRAAWQSRFPQKGAVMSSFDHMYDEYARFACGKEVVKVHDPGLQKILRLAGVRYAAAFYPDHGKNAKIVAPAPEEKAVLDQALHILRKRGLIDETFRVFVYEPHARSKKKPDLGFCVFKGVFRGVYILRSMLGDLVSAVETLYHEFAHARTGAVDGSREFDDRKDTDVARLLIEDEGLPYPFEVDPGSFSDTDPDSSPDTARALTLIDRMIDAAEPEPSKK